MDIMDAVPWYKIRVPWINAPIWVPVAQLLILFALASAVLFIVFWVTSPRQPRNE
jgi:hypothetical protein